jgi:hypothetical protein
MTNLSRYLAFTHAQTFIYDIDKGYRQVNISRHRNHISKRIQELQFLVHLESNQPFLLWKSIHKSKFRPHDELEVLCQVTIGMSG